MSSPPAAATTPTATDPSKSKEIPKGVKKYFQLAPSASQPVAQGIDEELRAIRNRPGRSDPQDAREENASADQPMKPHPDSCMHDASRLRLVGLAFSGGGIRSATFCLGILQSLERLGLLRQMDYISSVSGGGYISSWFLACRRNKIASTEDHAAVGHLRSFGRYLAPAAGFFSADTWTIAMIWLRNSMLLQAILVSFIALLLLLPRFFQWALTNFPVSQLILARISTFGLLAFSFAAMLVLLFKQNAGEKQRTGIRSQTTKPLISLKGQGALQILALVPLMGGMALFASLLWNTAKSGVVTPPGELLFASALLAVCSFVAAYISILRDYKWRIRALAGSILVGAVCGALFFALGLLVFRLFQGWARYDCPGPGSWKVGLLGAPLLVSSVSLCVVLQIGLVGRAMDDSIREWWSRLGAFLGIYSFAVFALDLLAIWGPLFTFSLANWIVGAAAGGGLLTTIAGLIAACSSHTSGTGRFSVKEILASIAPFAFILLLLVMISTGIHYGLTVHYFQSSVPPPAPQAGCDVPPNNLAPALAPQAESPRSPVAQEMVKKYWQALGRSSQQDIRIVLWSFIALAVVCLILAWRVDINEFSMSPFYRNRLVRCFLGAARAARGERKPNPFTKFDFKDDFGLAELKQPGYDGPIPIINTALNMVGGGDAGLQERRASSFFFTPYCSGSEPTGVRPTIEFGKGKGGITIGRCITTSGAAASPNMGYHTKSTVAFLMTFFNVRLGLWTRSPKFPASQQGARWGFWYLLKELFGTAGDDDKFLYLSDGGHFENLGVYELIRRRCRYIIACDAEQDEHFVMSGLGGLIRKCRIDFDVDIEIDTRKIRTRDASACSEAHYALGRIRYDRNDRDKDGYLVYLKASLTGDEDGDILQYKAENAAFPHQSTADQFFDESQFESYRRLGQHIAESAFEPCEPGSFPLTVSDEWMKRLLQRWSSSSPQMDGHEAQP